MIVLGIETSCDETGVAVYDSERGLLVNLLHSQVEVHAKYGGVVPELASRDHIRKLVPLVKLALDQANLGSRDIDGIAYTAGPGLVGALLVGASVSRSLAWAWGVPGIAVHHMEAHLLAPMLDDPAPKFPLVALLISGGHTQLVKVVAVGQYELLGQSLDDAAGEAFDKTAKLMGLPYPGGPVLAEFAKKGRPDRFKFPRPMVDRPGLDFSFSGLKTFTMNTFKLTDKGEQAKADIAWAFQESVADTLTIKCRRALRQTNLKRLVVAGGVSANCRIREKLSEMAKLESAEVYTPQPKFCTDNGAMIAYTGCQRLQAGQSDSLAINARPRWALTSLPAL